MEGKIITIKDIRERKDPEYFIDNVLNTPARLARVKAKRDAYWAEVQKRQAEAEEQKQRMEEQEALLTRTILGGMGFVLLAAIVGAM